MTQLQNPMSQAVQASQAAAEPVSYANRYGFDFDQGVITANMPGAKAPHNPVTTRQVNGRTEFYIHDLAPGDYTHSVGAAQVSVDYWDAFDYWAETDSAWNSSDRDKNDIRRAMEYWRKDPLVYKCVKFLTQLANSRLVVESDDDEVATLVKLWINSAMGHSFREQWFREYFRSGFVVALKALIPYVPRDYRDGKIPQPNEDGRVVAGNRKARRVRMAKARALMSKGNQAYQNYLKEAKRLEKFEKAHAEGCCSDQRLKLQAGIVVRRQYEWLQGMVPAAYTLLSPMAVNIEGPEEMDLLRQPYLTVGDALMQAVRHPTEQQAEFINALPVELVQQIRKGARKVWLSPNICSITFSDKQDYEVYPTPMIRHAFKALQMKDALIAADEHTAKHLKERILKVTIGNDTFPVLNPDSIARLKSVFQRREGLAIYWNHTLDIEWIEPGLEAFMDPAKYNLWDDQIRTCFGISRIFTGTSETSGAIGNSIMNFRGLEEEVTTAQDAFLEFLNKEINLLKKALGIGKMVHVKFVKLNLRDEAEFIGVMQQLVQNGILDPRTALETLGYHFPTVVQRLKDTRDMRKKDNIFVPLPSANNMGPDGGILPSPAGGKPKKAPLADNNKNKRGKSQPKKAAAARFACPDRTTCRLVVDADRIEDEAAEQLAAAFEIPKDWVMSRAQYQHAYGEQPKFVVPWPELDTRETVACVRLSQELLNQIEQRDQALQEQAKAEKREQHAGGKRGPYLTQKQKAQINQQVVTEALAPYQLDDPDMDERFGAMTDQLAGEDGLGVYASAQEILVTATVMLHRRHQKLQEIRNAMAGDDPDHALVDRAPGTGG